jgi:Kef-type K+ transport system membrane component KefB
MNPILASLMAIVGALLGTGFGSRLTRANEDRKWRRDHALEAYSEFMRLISTITMEAGNCYRIECGTEEHAKHGVMLVEKLTELYRTNDRVVLLASYELQRLLNALTKHVVGEFITKSNQCPKAPEGEVKALGDKLAQLSTDFIFTARNDLGVHGMPKKPWWWFGVRGI